MLHKLAQDTRSAVQAATRDSRDAAAALTTVVNQQVRTTAQEVAESATAGVEGVRSIVTGSVESAGTLDIDFGDAVRTSMRTAALAISALHGDVQHAMRNAASGAVAGARRLDRDVGEAAIAAVAGAREAAERSGMEARDAAEAAARGVLRAAEESGRDVAERAREALAQAQSLPRETLDEIRRHPRGSA